MNQLFNLYTNTQEYKNDFPDSFGRARFYNSGNKDIFSPVVSQAIHSRGLKPHYPGNKQFAVCVSHDIDHLFRKMSPQRKALNAGKSVLQGRFGQGADYLKLIIKDKVYEEYDLNRLGGINNKYKVRSTYYFLSLNTEDEDFNYHPHDIQDQFKSVIANGGEIGLHGGHRAYNSLTKLNEEKQRLEECIGKPVYGYRNHFLRFELPVTWNNLENAGFVYDTTLGYADCIGFRNGMCYPYQPFDKVSNKFLDIIELPLIIMDATIFYYMRMDAEIAFKICRQLIDKIKACGGVLTLLWHNNFLSGEMGSFYIKLLDFLQSAGAWTTTSLELVNWWKEEKILDRSQQIIRELFKEELA